MYQLDTPVLFLVFNRIDVTKEVLSAIAKAKPPRLYIACDGPRKHKSDEAQIVSQVRKYILDNIDWHCEVKTLFRDENLGCGLAVSSAISWFFEHEEMGIILEDDCLPSNGFFRFCQEMLYKYQNDKRIWHIGGYSILQDSDLSLQSYYFSQMTQIWGWASWRDRWQEYDLWMKNYHQYITQGGIVKASGSYRLQLWHKQLFEDNLGQTKTWDCQWYFTALINNGLSVTPMISLTQNLGFGSTDSAHPEIEGGVVKAIVANDINFPLVHPSLMSIDFNLDTKYFKWRTKNGVILKELAKPFRKIDETLFNKKIITLYKKLFTR